MEIININSYTDINGHLQIDIPTGHKKKNLQVVVIINEISNSKNKYDFSNLSGKLKWDGNALDEQKKLRDEWK